MEKTKNQFQLPEKLLHKLSQEAEEELRSVESQLNKILTDYFAKKGKETMVSSIVVREWITDELKAISWELHKGRERLKGWVKNEVDNVTKVQEYYLKIGNEEIPNRVTKEQFNHYKYLYSLKRNISEKIIFLHNLPKLMKNDVVDTNPVDEEIVG